jgi:hypothetical protein
MREKKQDGEWKGPMDDGLPLWSPTQSAKNALWVGHPAPGIKNCNRE